MREKIRDRGRLEHIIEQLHNIDEFLCDKSFEDLGDHVLTNFEILELMKNAGF